MTYRTLAKKLEMTRKLCGIEGAVAKLIIERRQKLASLVKMKNYATMRSCNFRDKQIKKLIGERNG
jgi:hypothetical protein